MAKSVATDNFVVENVVLSYPHLFAPQQVQGVGEPKYSASLLIPEGPALQRIQQEAQKIAAKAFTNGETQLPNFRWPWMPAAQKAQYAGNPRFANHMIVNVKASQDYPPQVLDENREKIFDRGEIYPGCIVAVLMRLYTYNNMGNVGVGAGFSAVMKMADGERLDTSVDAAAAFANVQVPQAPQAPVAQQPPGFPPQAPQAPVAQGGAPAQPAGATPQAPEAPPGWNPQTPPWTPGQ